MATKGPRPARSFRIYKHPNYAGNVGVDLGGAFVPLHAMTRVELVKACANTGLRVPEPYTRWLEIPNDKLQGLLMDYDAPSYTLPERDDRRPDPTPTPVPVSQETETPTPKRKEPTVTTDTDQALEALKKILGGGIDPAQLEVMVEQAVTKVVSRPVVVTIGDMPPVTFDDELVHECFPRLMRKVHAGAHVMMTGGPGVGKTTVADQVARALGLRHVVATMKPLPQDHELLGFVSPVTGQVVTGQVRELYEHGGVLTLDEFDTAHPATPPTLNMLLAQDYYDFPQDGGGTVRVRKHKDFRVLATGNTYGGGGSLEFSGTTRMNTATLDRFTFFHVGIDPKLEDAICRSIDPTFGPLVVDVVRKARANIEQYALKVFVTPRASIDATKMMVAGDSLREALDGRLFGRGLPKDQEAKLLEGVTFG